MRQTLMDHLNTLFWALLMTGMNLLLGVGGGKLLLWWMEVSR